MNWLDIIIAAPLILATIQGYRTGFVMQVATFVGITFSIIFAGKASEIIAPYTSGIVSQSSALASPVLYIASFLLIMLAFIILGKTIESLFKVAQLNFFNRMLGAAFSLATWTLAISVVLMLIINIDQKQILLKEPIKQSSHLYEPFVSIGETLVPFLKTKSEAILAIDN